MYTRRQLLAAPLLAAAKKKTVAAIVTEYRHWSHADVVVGRLLGGYSVNNVYHESRSRVVSMFTHQTPPNQDMSRDLAARFGFKIYPTIEGALTLGGPKLAVDAVVFVGEHGNYPNNDVGQKLYPRYELFSQILDVYEKSGRGVPTFFDKHLSYSWEKAKEMYDRAARLKLPWMAGSSVPVTARTPPLEIALGTPVTEAVALGHGDLDAYGFHLLESLQCMVERRAGGETGVAAVEWVEGDAVQQWLDSAGGWTKPLREAARAAGGEPASASRNPVLFRLEYRDGLKAVAIMLSRGGNDRSVAARAGDRILATSFGPKERTRPLPHFDGLVYCIDEMFHTGKPLYPVERTLLTTGVLAKLFESRRAKRRLETPELAVAYKSPAKIFVQHT